MFHQVSDKKYKALQLRNQRLRDSDYKGIDDRMIPVLRLLYHVEGIQPIWSCSGHTLYEQEQMALAKPGCYLTDRPWQEWYVMFAAGRNAEPFMQMLSQLVQKTPDCRFQLSAGTLRWYFDAEGNNGNDLIPATKLDRYPVWQISFTHNVTKIDDYQNLVNKFTSYLTDFIIKQDGRINLGY